MITEVNISKKFELIDEYWTPKIIGELNGQFVKLAKIKDELIWHSHQAKVGEILIIPKTVEHRPRTNGEEVWIMLIEPKDTKHTGDIEHKKTVKNFEWI